MPATRRLLLTALPFTAASALAFGLPAAGATPVPAPLPQYVVQFNAIGSPATPTVSEVRSGACRRATVGDALPGARARTAY